MKTVIRIVGSPLGDHTIADNRFVRAYSADGGGGHGTLETTEDIELALGFDDVAAALECWRAVSTTHPLRPYILDGHTPVLVNDTMSYMTWATWMETAERHVGLDKVGEIEVSTVFLGRDTGKNDPPMLFETMLFTTNADDWRSPVDEWLVLQCATWDKAEIMHRLGMRFAESRR
jgi:hypothetical protein